MTIEVHSFGREISPGRTTTAALFLLVISCVLAVAMCWKRADNPLVPVTFPPDWNMRFQVPRMLDIVVPRLIRGSTVLPFAGKTADNVEVFCVLWKGEAVAPVDLEAAAHRLMADVRVGTNLFGEVRTSPATTGPMGDFDGAEFVSFSQTAVVRIVNVEGEVYAVLFAVRGSKLDPDIYHLFDLTCRSMSLARK